MRLSFSSSRLSCEARCALPCCTVTHLFSSRPRRSGILTSTSGTRRPTRSSRKSARRTTVSAVRSTGEVHVRFGAYCRPQTVYVCPNPGAAVLSDAALRARYDETNDYDVGGLAVSVRIVQAAWAMLTPQPPPAKYAMRHFGSSMVPRPVRSACAPCATQSDQMSSTTHRWRRRLCIRRSTSRASSRSS